MKAITNNKGTTELHTVRSRKKSTFFKKPQQDFEKKDTFSKSDKKSFKKPFKSKGCFRCRGKHDKST